MQNLTITELAERMKKGEEDAFVEVYERFHTSFYYMALKLCKCDADAKEAVQETFIQIHKSVGTLQEPSILIVWMKKILFGKCKNIFRKNQKEVLMENSSLLNMERREERIDFLPNVAMQHNTIKETVMKLIQNIPYIYQEPILLKYYGQHTMEEIGHILDIPTGTVKSRLRTGKQLLQMEIKNFERKEGQYHTFHSLGLGYILTAAFAYDAKVLNSTNVVFSNGRVHPTSLGSKFVSAIGVKTGTLCVVACAVAVPVGVKYITTKHDEKEKILQNQEIQVTNMSDQDAYFHLKNWAHCKEEMKKKTVEDFRKMEPYFHQLEYNNGVFWNLLYQEGWVENYIKFRK